MHIQINISIEEIKAIRNAICQVSLSLELCADEKRIKELKDTLKFLKTLENKFYKL